MEHEKWIADRLAKLRIERGISAREMSLSLGQSESYINKIENGRTLPSIRGLISICEYLEIEPNVFWDNNIDEPIYTQRIVKSLQKLSPTQLQHILQIIEDLCAVNEKTQ